MSTPLTEILKYINQVACYLFLAEILKANDELTRAIDEYRKKIGSDDPNLSTSSSQAQSTAQAITESTGQLMAASQPLTDENGSSLIDLGMSENRPTVDDANSSVLDDELRALGKLLMINLQYCTWMSY